jgi:hypothetical protein
MSLRQLRTVCFCEVWHPQNRREAMPFVAQEAAALRHACFAL